MKKQFAWRVQKKWPKGKWEVVGYSLGGKYPYTLLQDSHGRNKRVRGIK